MKVTKALLVLFVVTFLNLNGMETQTQTIEKDPKFQDQVKKIEKKARKKRCDRISFLKCCVPFYKKCCLESSK